jgi:hypothetical protein
LKDSPAALNAFSAVVGLIEVALGTATCTTVGVGLAVGVVTGAGLEDGVALAMGAGDAFA